MQTDEHGNFCFESGKVLRFSKSGFDRLIQHYPSQCFICGAIIDKDMQKISLSPSNGEHVIPSWLINHFRLIGREGTMTIPSGQSLSYGKKMPCCTTCNSDCGSHFEKPIAEQVKSGNIKSWLTNEMNILTFQAWLAFIFIKTHLFEKDLFDIRHRSPAPRRLLGDGYDYESMHNMHTLLRAVLHGHQFAAPEGLRKRNVFGSIHFFDIKEDGVNFDFCSSLAQQTIYMRFNNFGAILVLGDQGFTECLAQPILSLKSMEPRLCGTPFDFDENARRRFSLFCALSSSFSMAPSSTAFEFIVRKYGSEIVCEINLQRMTVLPTKAEGFTHYSCGSEYLDDILTETDRLQAFQQETRQAKAVLPK